MNQDLHPAARRATHLFHPSAAGRGARIVLRIASVVLAAGCGPEGEIEPPEPMPGEPVVEYPVTLWDAGVEGETILMVHVTETGTVDSAYIDQSSGLEEFDSAAIRGGRMMRFTPGNQGGERRAMWTRLPVRFRRAPPGASPLETPGSRG